MQYRPLTALALILSVFLAAACESPAYIHNPIEFKRDAKILTKTSKIGMNSPSAIIRATRQNFRQVWAPVLYFCEQGGHAGDS